MARQSTIAAVRFGYGFHPKQPAPQDGGALLDQARLALRADPPMMVDDKAVRRAKAQAFRDARGDQERRKALRRELRLGAFRDIAARYERRALSPHGFRGRLAAFWLDHFTVGFKNISQFHYYAGYEDETLRPYLGGHFADMLKAVVRAPAMLRYLDQVASIGPNSPIGRKRGRGLNENLAREVLELHTLGVGAGYSQTDVREFAELLTGFAFRPAKGTFRFVPRRAEPGTETVLGRRYGGDPARASDVDELLEDLTRHPATARHLATKLAAHFVADEPDPDLVWHIEAAWTRGGGALMPVYEALLEHPAAWAATGGKVKRPQDLVLSTLRASGVRPANAGKAQMKRGRLLFRSLRTMNQPPFQAPGPDGWAEEAEAWITPQGLAARLEYASAAGKQLGRSGDLDPRDFAKIALRDLLTENTKWVVNAAPERWEGFALVLASPEFNRR